VGTAHAFCFVGERFAGERQVTTAQRIDITARKGKEEHMTTPARLQGLIEPIVTGLGLELFDLQYTGSVLTVMVDRARPAEGGPRPGVAMAEITAVSRALSRMLDEADPIAGHYSLEVSSPGLERPLRTPAHFAGAVGELISVKTVAAHDGPRRLRGELVRASAADDDDASIDVSLEDSGALHTVPYADIERARTVFVWGPEPKPSKPKPPKSRPAKREKPARDRGDDPPPERSSRAPVTEERDVGHAEGGSATLHGTDAMINGDDKKVSAQ
jgi:ribosome maturation factor RimP